MKRRSLIVIGKKEVAELWTDKEMRQGCPLSPMLFNIVFADLEKRMRRCQEAGLMLGREKILLITYADDGALLAGSAEGLQEIVERFGRYVERKGLRINVEKSKVMRFRKGAGRWNEMEI